VLSVDLTRYQPATNLNRRTFISLIKTIELSLHPIALQTALMTAITSIACLYRMAFQRSRQPKSRTSPGVSGRSSALRGWLPSCGTQCLGIGSLSQGQNGGLVRPPACQVCTHYGGLRCACQVWSIPCHLEGWTYLATSSAAQCDGSHLEWLTSELTSRVSNMEGWALTHSVCIYRRDGGEIRRVI